MAQVALARARRWLLPALALAAAGARAAGGHHAVDDAVMIEPGLCEFESWADRERGAARTLLHAGLGCRTGPVELGLGADRARAEGSPAASTLSPQLKWATPLSERLSAGLVLWGVWQAGSDGGVWSTTLLVPVTWQAADGLQLHLNAGRDFPRGEAATPRAGAALEWTATPAWSVVGERYRESNANFWRLGGRWSPTPRLSVDLSRAAGLGGAAAPWWTLGVKLAFDR